MKTDAFRWMIAGTSIGGILWLVSGCGGDSADHATTLVTSQTRIAKAAQAMLAYTADWDGTLPGKNWMDATSPYAKDPDAYKSPAVGGDGYGFAFNEALVGKSLSKISDKATTVMLFDSTVIERNAVAALSTMPNPARYGGENTVAYADGSVKNSPASEDYKEACGRLRKIGVALLAYSGDFDEHLPPAKNWQEALRSYTTSQDIFHDPSLLPAEFGFALNKDVAGKKTAEIGPLGSTPIVFSSTSVVRDAVAGLDTLPSPGRYGGKNAILYLDGHTSAELEKQAVKAEDGTKSETNKPTLPKPPLLVPAPAPVQAKP